MCRKASGLKKTCNCKKKVIYIIHKCIVRKKYVNDVEKFLVHNYHKCVFVKSELASQATK